MLSYMNQGGAKVPDASLELPESRRPRQWACQAEPRPWHGTGKGQPEDRVTPTVEYQLWVTVTGQPDQGPGAVVDPDNTWLGPANFNLKLQRHNKWFQAKASLGNPMVTLTSQSLLSQVAAGSLSRRYRQGWNWHYKRSRLLVPAVILFQLEVDKDQWTVWISQWLRGSKKASPWQAHNSCLIFSFQLQYGAFVPSLPYVLHWLLHLKF